MKKIYYMGEWHEQIGPVLDHYRSGGRLHQVTGQGTVEEISAGLASAIDRIRLRR